MFFDRKRDERNAVDLDIPIANEEKKNRTENSISSIQRIGMMRLAEKVK